MTEQDDRPEAMDMQWNLVSRSSIQVREVLIKH